MVKVKIYCHCCEGKKTIEEKAYPKGNIVNVECPECAGDGWVFSTEIVQK